MVKVYLAGPMVFWPNAEEIFEKMREILSNYELQGISPLDNQMGLETAQPGRGLARAIYAADEQLMRSVDAAIFNLDPFRRGTEMDPGTAFEVGFCKATNLPMTGWTTDYRFYPEKVRDYMRNIFNRELVPSIHNEKGGASGLLRDHDGILVHSQGMYQNLMIEIAIENSGGVVCVDECWEVAFGLAAKQLNNLLSSKRDALST